MFDMLDDLHAIQAEFNDLHEEIYKKGGVKPTNAAIDEVCKLVFLKLHLENEPDYRMQRSIAQDKRFADIFRASYVQLNGKSAVRELQDAFLEISTLPRYAAIQVCGDSQTIFAYQEPLRLDHPDVLAKAIAIVSKRQLSVSDAQVLDDSRKQWEAFSHQDMLGSAFDVFLRGRYDSAGGLGTYLTPTPVVNAMVEMGFSHISDQQLWARRGDSGEVTRWQPASGEEDLPAFLIGDICCGTARFLVRALAEIRDRVVNAPEKDNAGKLAWLAKIKKYSFFGADQSASSILKARINFLMFGEPHAQLLTVEDSILDERVDRLAGKFDLLLTNPPFGEGKYETEPGLEKMRQRDLGLQLGWSWKPGNGVKTPLRRADPALLFLDRNLQLLKPNGLLLIVLPDGILESAYTYAHQYLLGKAALRAVVSLPKDTFAISGTTAKTSFICLQKLEGGNPLPHPVFMAVANHVGYVKKGTVEVPDPQGNDLLDIVKAYKARATTGIVPESASSQMIALVPRSDLRDTLTAHTYHPDRLHAEKTVAAMNEEARSLGDLVSLVKPIVAGRTRRTQYFISVLHVDEKSNIDWEAAAAHRPTSKGLRCHPGEVIFSCLNPSKVRVAVIPEDLEGEILCSTEFAILRVRPGADPYFVALALKAQTSQRQFIPLARGTSSSRRRIRDEDLLRIIIPYPNAEMRREIGAQFRDAIERTRRAYAQGHLALKLLDQYILANGKKAPAIDTAN